MSTFAILGAMLHISLAFNMTTAAVAIEPARARAVADRLFEAFNRHDIDAMAGLYAADAEIISPDHPKALRGPAGARAIYTPLFARFPDLHDRVVTMTAQGDRVAVEFVSNGCAAPAKECFELPIVSVLTVRDGRIVGDVSYFDAP
jgi:ketosteroid isomerase-like protein